MAKVRNINEFLTEASANQISQVLAKKDGGWWLEAAHGKYSVRWDMALGNVFSQNFMGLSRAESSPLLKNHLYQFIHPWLRERFLNDLAATLDTCESSSDGQAVFDAWVDTAAGTLGEIWNDGVSQKIDDGGLPKKYSKPTARKRIEWGPGRARGVINHLVGRLVFAIEDHKETLGPRLVPWMNPTQDTSDLYMILIAGAIAGGQISGIMASNFDKDLIALAQTLQDRDAQAQYEDFCREIAKTAQLETVHFCASGIFDTFMNDYLLSS